MTITNMERRSLKDISWQVTEEEYRQDPALSYSTMARYERGGFGSLETLFEKAESPSLTFGSVVDTLITAPEDFDKLFLVAQLETTLSDTQIQITKKAFELFHSEHSDLKNVSDNELLSLVLEDIPWNNHWKPETRVKKIKEDCRGYYQLLYIADGRTIIDTFTYNDAINVVDRLKAADATRFYFEPNNVFDNSIERFYQLKFKANLEGVDYRCMADKRIYLN